MFYNSVALFQSLLFEAAGRTVNPVNGAVGLLWTGNWHVCQAAVETVLRGGALRPIPELLGANSTSPDLHEQAASDMFKQLGDPSGSCSQLRAEKRRRPYHPLTKAVKLTDLELSLTADKRRAGTPSRNSEESVTTTCCESGLGGEYQYNDDIGEPKLLNLF